MYDLILHNYGPDIKIGSLHINVYDTMTAHEIHGLTRKITMQMAERENVTEGLKADDQMEWLRRMNSIWNRAEEIVLHELIYV